MSKMLKIMLVLAMVLSLRVVAYGADLTKDADWSEPSATKFGKAVTVGRGNYKTEVRMEIFSFGHGVYYFEYPETASGYRQYGKVFAETLADFIKNNDWLELVSIAPNANEYSNNYVNGFFVIFTKKNK